MLALVTTANARAAPPPCESRLRAAGFTPENLQLGETHAMDGFDITVRKGDQAPYLCQRADALANAKRVMETALESAQQKQLAAEAKVNEERTFYAFLLKHVLEIVSLTLFFAGGVMGFIVGRTTKRGR